jgi:nucleoside-diphosphate-sugar epimerase
MDIAVCRFFNVYGPHQDVLRTSPPFTSYLSREFVLGRAPKVFNWTDARRDYVYVDDVVDLLARICDYDGSFRGERFNICSGQGYTVPEIYEHFVTVSGKQLDPIREDPERYWDSYPALFEGSPLSRERIKKEVFKNAIGDPAKAREWFGWTARMAMSEGIAAVYEDAQRRLAR